MGKLKKGYVHIYTGDGKGKTTAAIGLSIRAIGCGMKVFIAQFIKGMKYSEIKILERLSDDITVKQYGRGCFIKGKPKEEDVIAAREGLSDAKRHMLSKAYDIVILDEINVADYFGLIETEEIIEFVKQKPVDVELVLTGRRADERLIELADLVTEMKEVKHYYSKGIAAREGIER